MSMDIIRGSNDYPISMLGYQMRTKDKKYRLNKFCIMTPYDEGVLINNCFTGALIYLPDIEYSNINTEEPCTYVDFMIQNWFLVTEDFDEEYACKILKERQEVPLLDTYLDHPNGFTILSTSACNARCFYCYELGLKGKVHMSKETAEKVAKYIVSTAPKQDMITLDWFGGEPLFNHQIIDLITSRVASAGFNFVSSMISNGYLFDDKLVKKAEKDWHLKSIQITLDGTEEVYNKTKAYIYKDCESPFKRVIENIHRLLRANINVSIRINIDKHNFDNLVELANFLGKEFSGESNLSVYAHTVFEEGFTRTDEEEKELYEHLLNLEKLLEDLHIFGGQPVKGEIKGLHCMIDGGNHVCIFPKGEIGVCEHYLDKYFVSHIDNPNEKNWDILKMWREYTPYTEICEDCPLKPVCLKSKYCPDESSCNKYQKEYELERFKLGMIKLYRQFLENPPSCSDGSCQQCPQHDPYCTQHGQGSSQWQQVFSDGRVVPVKTYKQ